MASGKLGMADRIKDIEMSVTVQLSELARSTGAVNVGLGFPNYPPPDFVSNAINTIGESGEYMLNQYTRCFGHPRLVNAIAKMYGPLIQRRLDPMKEVLVTAGAIESLFCTFQGLVNPEDEVIIIEPFFACFLPLTKIACGKCVFVPLRPSKSGSITMTSSDWKLDPVELASKFNGNTKMIILNTPNNPLGKVFNREELSLIAQLCVKYNVICVADEVYEWITYPGMAHIRMATLPSMWDRTITICSAGKSFSATGWRIGWSYGPEHLMKSLMAVHQNCVYTCCTPLQEAVAHMLESEHGRLDNQDECYFHTLPNTELLPKRDKIAALLQDCGMSPIVPDGGYFMMADWTQLGIADDMIEDGTHDTKDVKFVKWLMKEKKLAAFPCSMFYGPENQQLAEKFIRVCFFKSAETIDAVSDILKSFK